MKEKILLPFDYVPELLTYQSVAFPLGIIQGNTTQSIMPWLSSRYINCWFSSSYLCNFSYFEEDDWGTNDEILIKNRIGVSNDPCSITFEPYFTPLLKKLLQTGHYIYGVYNEEFIPGKYAFQKEYYGHDYLLLGYDDTIESFISVGYSSNKKFQQFLIPYECMERALTTLHIDKFFLDSIKYNSNAIYQANLERIISALSDYLNSVNSTNSQPSYLQECSWGLSAFSNTGKFIVDMCNESNYIDLRNTRAVMEFKKLMHTRIHYLLSNKVIKNKKYLDCAFEAFRLSESSHLLGIKFNLTKEKNYAYRLNDMYEKILSLECLYLPDILSDLQFVLQ